MANITAISVSHEGTWVCHSWQGLRHIWIVDFGPI